MRALLALLLTCLALQAQVSISQIYGGGGNSGATLRNDFIEIFNRGTQPADLNGWVVQYGSAAGTDWQTTALKGTLQPGRYYLIQEAAGAGGTTPLPAPDAQGDIAMSATAGRVAVVSPDGTIRDLVRYAALSNTTAATRRGAGCTDTGNPEADFQIGPPAPRNSASPGVNCSAPPPDNVPATISRIQGSGNVSPLLAQRVETKGVVTGRKSNGFFLQSLPADEDGDPETSEGIFVFTSSAPPASAARGNVVNVVGTVAEFQTLTELTEPVVSLISTGAVLPDPVVLPSMQSLERFEGMRVRYEWVVATSPSGGTVNEPAASATSNGSFFAVFARSPRPYLDPLLSFDRIRVSAGLDVTSGTALKNLQGPLDYQLGAYTIVQDPDFPPMVYSSNRIAEPVIALSPGEFSLASMNLQRLFDDRDDPSVSDAVLTSAAYNGRIARIARTIREYLRSPDIIGVQEVENIDVLRTLASAAGDYEAYLIEGNDIGGIDVGILAKRARVRVLSAIQVGKETRYNGRDLTWDRPPLVVQAEVDGTPITVVVNHLRSLINADSPQVSEKRYAQLAGFSELLASLTGAVVSIGDYNADQAQLQPRLPRGYSNLTDSLAPADNYSYVFDGTTQTIDHVIVSDSAKGMLTRLQYARLNADFPESLRNDATRVERSSDHDFPVAYFSPRPVALRAIGVTNAATYRSGAIAANEAVTVFGSFPSGSQVTVNGVTASVLYQNAAQLTFAVPASITGRTATLAIGSATVTMPVADAAPGLFAVSGFTAYATGLGNPEQCAVSLAGLPFPITRSTQIAPGIFQLDLAVASANRVNRGYVLACFDKTSPAALISN